MRSTLWDEPLPSRRAAPLGNDVHVDVCVIGAGMAGLCVAYQLLLDGRTVAVIDGGPIAGGESGRTTAHLTTALDASWARIAWLHGEERARLAAESHRWAIDRIEAIVASERIACDFERVPGYLMLADGSPASRLEDEVRAARAAGLAVEWVERAPLPRFDSGRCVRFPHQGQFHPARFLHGLAGAVERHGGRLHAFTQATSVDAGPPARVVTDRRAAVVADAVVVATNTPFNYAVTLHTKQAAYRTYLVTAKVERGAVPHALYWDTAEPFHYVRIHPASGGANDTLVVGGEDHKTGQDEEGPERRFARLANWARRRFPMEGVIDGSWSGQVMESMDGLSFIGRADTDSNVYVVTGDSGNGLTHGVIAGIMIAESIGGHDGPWTEVYDPKRLRLRATGEFLRQNVNAVAQLGAWLSPGTADTSSLASGAGCVVRRGLSRIAVYRDADGGVHEVSAVCPHLGCIVGWNPVEGTWDCPCHGSRFDPTGHVVNGPAVHDLAPVEGESPAPRLI